MFDELRNSTTGVPEWDAIEFPTYVVRSDVDAVFAIGHLMERFGADDSLQAVRIRFPQKGPAYLARADAYRFASSTMGFGDAGRSTLPSPGPAGSLEEYEFNCEVKDCPESPVFMLSFDEPPSCPRHDRRLKLVTSNP